PTQDRPEVLNRQPVGEAVGEYARCGAARGGDRAVGHVARARRPRRPLWSGRATPAVAGGVRRRPWRLDVARERRVKRHRSPLPHGFCPPTTRIGASSGFVARCASSCFCMSSLTTGSRAANSLTTVWNSSGESVTGSVIVLSYVELSVRSPKLASAVSNEASAAFAPFEPVTVGLTTAVAPKKPSFWPVSERFNPPVAAVVMFSVRPLPPP